MSNMLSAGSKVAEALSKLRDRKVSVQLRSMEVAETSMSNFGGVVRMEAKLEGVRSE